MSFVSFGRRPRQQSGFSMLEVLVTMVVIAIGLLGLAALQLQALQYNQSAYTRSQATVLAYDILDKMRANRVAARAGSYDIALAATVPTGTDTISTDLRLWKTGLAAALTDGDGSVTVNNDLVTIIVQWDDDRAASADIQQFYFRTEL